MEYSWRLKTEATLKSTCNMLNVSLPKDPISEYREYSRRLSESSGKEGTHDCLANNSAELNSRRRVVTDDLPTQARETFDATCSIVNENEMCGLQAEIESTGVRRRRSRSYRHRKKFGVSKFELPAAWRLIKEIFYKYEARINRRFRNSAVYQSKQSNS